MEKTKNTFQDGLIMDFSPDNTGATSLTSALNATILTFNGNEMALQNDMGNGRVETAYLPEGYIPVGTCEFGDIIYIASYNPLTNRALIGCFPSPERNISSEELSDLKTSINYTDFLEIDTDNNPTGILKSMSVRKVLIDNRNINPGDKYIIFSEQASDNFEKFGELDNSKKYLKLSVVSIDEDGKITYLDTDTHYYQYKNDEIIYDHFISPKATRTETDIDEYRNLLQSGWNLFSSKNPGKLAILAELNTIDTFSCTYSIIVDEITTGEGGIRYTVYFTPIFESTSDLKIYLSRENENVEIEEDGDTVKKYFKISQDQFGGNKDLIINITNPEDTSVIKNYHSTSFDTFGGPITEEGDIEPIISGHSYLAFSITLPKVVENEVLKAKELVYLCDIIPAMPFGKLNHLAVPITIDFNKLGTGEINLTRWKYYNLGTLCILQYGLEIYNKPNYETVSVTIDFYDNTGHAARYLLSDVDSFSGIHTEYLGLNGENYNYRLSKLIEARTPYDFIILHKGTEYKEFDSNLDKIYDKELIETLTVLPSDDGLYRVESDLNYVFDSSDLKIYTNDAGTLYSNALYAACITVKSKNLDNEIFSLQYWRWLWTNSMYNEYYYLINDFNDLKFMLDLDATAIFEATPLYEWKELELNNLNNGIEDGFYNSYSANVLYIGQGEEDNIKLYILAGLQNDYGCFNLPLSILDDSNILSEIYLGKSVIDYSSYENNYEFSSDSTVLTEEQYLKLLLIINKNEKTGTENNSYINKTNPINVLGIALEDVFNLTFEEKDISGSLNLQNTIEDDEVGSMTAPKLICSLGDCYYADSNNKKGIELKLAASIFTKAYTYRSQKYTGECPIYSPIINSQKDLLLIGITSDDNDLLFQTGMIGMFKAAEIYSGTSLVLTNNRFENAICDDSEYKISNPNMTYNSYGNTLYVNDIYNNFLDNLSLFFVLYPGGYCPNGDTGYEWTSVYGNLGAETINPTFKGLIGYNGNSYELEKQLSWEWKGDTSILDISSSGGIQYVRPSSAVGILCVKHPSGGFVAFNNCSYDFDESWVSQQGNFLNQKAKIYDVDVTLYSNLAMPLYLILSRVYTKNKTEAINNLLKLYNYVRRSSYSTILTKDVIIKLYQNKEANILLNGLDYNLYKQDLINIILEEVDDLTKLNLNALNLSFNSCVKNNTLTININNIPLEFPDLESKALFTYNGGLIACNKIEDDQFYIYYDGELIPYYDQQFKFLKNDIISNLKYILNKDISDINVTVSKVTAPATEMELAADDLGEALYRFAQYSEFSTLANRLLINSKDTETRADLLEKLAVYLIDYFSCIDELYTLNGETYTVFKEEYSKWIIKYPQHTGRNGVLTVAYNIRNSADKSLLEVLIDSIIVYKTELYWEYLGLAFSFVHVDTKLNDMITIEPQLGLSENFQYSGNKLLLRENSPHDMLRICMGRYNEKPSDIYKGVNCIMKDVSIDITHRITKDVG